MSILSDLWIGMIAGTLTLFILSFLLRLVIRPLLPALSQLSANGRRLIAAVLLMLPAFSAIALTVVMATSNHHLPFDLIAHHCHADAAGCAAHGRGSDYLPLTAIGAGLLTVFVSWFLFGALEKLYAIRSSMRGLKPAVSGRLKTALILDVEAPLAFCAGLFSPKVYLSRGLTERLTPDEMDMVHLHEASHIKSMDLMVRFIVSLLSFGQFSSVRSSLMDMLICAQEEVCDQKVARRFGRVETAETLIKVQRLRHSVAMLSPHCVAAIDHGDISARTLALLSPENAASGASRLCIVAGGLLLALAMLVASEPLHHYFETLILSLKG